MYKQKQRLLLFLHLPFYVSPYPHVISLDTTHDPQLTTLQPAQYQLKIPHIPLFILRLIIGIFLFSFLFRNGCILVPLPVCSVGSMIGILQQSS